MTVLMRHNELISENKYIEYAPVASLLLYIALDSKIYSYFLCSESEIICLIVKLDFELNCPLRDSECELLLISLVIIVLSNLVIKAGP
jgi:hypothetical protein